MAALPNPFTMRGEFEWCYLLALRTPEAEARALLPPELELVTRDGWAFWNVVFCEIRGMRPVPVPTPLGLRYRHVAYRLYVRFRPHDGEPMEGLYFVRSDCNLALMRSIGNLLTDFRFHLSSIERELGADTIRLTVSSPDAPAHLLLDKLPRPELASGSPFGTLDEAAAFLKYKPRGMSVNEKTRRVSVVQIVREEAAWQSHLLRIERAELSFFRDKQVVPEICYDVQPLPYQWNRRRDFSTS